MFERQQTLLQEKLQSQHSKVETLLERKKKNHERTRLCISYLVSEESISAVASSAQPETNVLAG